MSVIIRREARQPKRGRFAAAVTVLALLAACGGVIALAWQKGGPEPVHVMIVDLPVQGDGR